MRPTIHPLYKQFKSMCKTCGRLRSKDKRKGPSCDDCFRAYQRNRQRDHRRKVKDNGQ